MHCGLVTGLSIGLIIAFWTCPSHRSKAPLTISAIARNRIAKKLAVGAVPLVASPMPSTLPYLLAATFLLPK